MRKLLSVLFVLWVSSAQADDYDLALAATCEKFKSCTFQEFEGQTVPPELKVMLEQGAQAACSGIDSIFVWQNLTRI